MLTPTEILGPTGRIAARLNNYEQRPQQLEMAEAVAAAIEGRNHLMVEAGTGVGKSFAYLVPAILAATAEPPTTEDDGSQESNASSRPAPQKRAAISPVQRTRPEPSDTASRPIRRIIISTHTIALQE